MITVLFSTNDMIGSRMVRAFTGSPWSHVDILTDKGTLIGALALEEVREYSLDVRVRDSTRYAVRLLDGDQGRAEAYARSQVGKAYDWLGIVGFIAPCRNWQSEDKWFCSELIARAAIKAGNMKINPDVNRITPGALYSYTVGSKT